MVSDAFLMVRFLAPYRSPFYRKHLDNIRKNPGPFTDPDAGSQEAIDSFDRIRVL